MTEEQIAEQPVTPPPPVVDVNNVPPSESAPETPPTDEQPKKAGKNGFQRRLDAQTRKYYEEKARADFLEGQFKKLQPAEQADPGEPDISKFADFDEFKKAFRKHVVEKTQKDSETQTRTETAKQHQQRLVGQWEERAEKGRDKYEDFDEKVGDLKPTAPVYAAIMDAENADEVAYYFAVNPAEFLKVAALSPLSQIRAVGRIEAKLLAEPPKPKTPSKAPPPITPVTAKHGHVEVDLEQADMKEFIKTRDKQKGRK